MRVCAGRSAKPIIRSESSFAAHLCLGLALQLNFTATLLAEQARIPVGVNTRASELSTHPFRQERWRQPEPGRGRYVGSAAVAVICDRTSSSRCLG